MFPARINSVKPTIAASEVPLINWTRNPIVAGSEMRIACGRTTSFIREM